MGTPFFASALAPLILLAAPASASTPADLARAALAKRQARLDRCLAGRPADARVLFRVSPTGWADVISIHGADDLRVRTCIKVVVEELHFPRAVRARMKHVLLPVRVRRLAAAR